MPEFIPKPLPYLDRLIKVQRIIKAAKYRPDQKIALRELCEAMEELAIALVEREQGKDIPPAGASPEQQPSAPNN